MEIILLLVSVVIILGVIIANIRYGKLPKKDLVDTSHLPKAYQIKTPNRIDYQEHYECAAYSTAYVLRHFGVEAKGIAIYKGFPSKFPGGTIAPKGIVRYLKKEGYKVEIFTGTIETLKKQITKGIPVIILIKVFPDKSYMHYEPIIGYDETYFYVVESLPYMKNCEERLYNRKIKQDELEALWKIGIPKHKNVYFTVSKL